MQQGESVKCNLLLAVDLLKDWQFEQLECSQLALNLLTLSSQPSTVIQTAKVLSLSTVHHMRLAIQITNVQSQVSLIHVVFSHRDVS